MGSRPSQVAPLLALSMMVLACASPGGRPVVVDVDPSGTGATTAAASTGTVEATGGGASERDEPVAECPASFAEASRVARCSFGMSACTYPEGLCACPPPPQCGGAEAPPPPKGAPLALVCVPNDPRATDARGCPIQVPSQGAPCTQSSIQCSYGACSWSQTIATCSATGWAVEHRMQPPPP